MSETLYRRPLPAETIAFASPEGRVIFREALEAGGLAGYFRLAEQFHTQSDPAFCGLGSLVVALNALGIDPGRLWKGPWRWFAEDLLDCCVPLEVVRQRGVNLDELGCLARCNGAEVSLERADGTNLASFRAALAAADRGESVLIAAYDRKALGQSGSGHFSPIGGYAEARDLALVLDVARFKYPPHWVSAASLWQAMLEKDPATGRARGFLSLRPRTLALGFRLKCDGLSWAALSQKLTRVTAFLASSPDIASLARELLPLTPHLELRVASAPDHTAELLSARQALCGLAAYRVVLEAVGNDEVESVLLLLLALADRLSPTQRDQLGVSSLPSALAHEVESLNAQLTALGDRLAPSCG